MDESKHQNIDPGTLGCLLLLLFIIIGCGNMTYPLWKDTQLVKWLVSATEFLTSPISPGLAKKGTYQSTGVEAKDTIPVSELRSGGIQILYPVYLLPNESETVSLKAYLSSEYAKVVPTELVRVPISPDALPVFSLGTYQAQTLLYKTMRAELVSQGLAVSPIQENVTKEISFTEPGTPTTWGWIIQSPEYTGRQVFVLSIYVADNLEAIWFGSFEVQVVSPTSTPMPGATPTPTSEPILEKTKNVLIENIAAVLGSLLAFVLGLLGIYFQFVRPNQHKNDRNTRLKKSNRN